eukprot:XP_014772236.1 PREDICTED: uncharacterized protein LOC106870620 [Octopus bimaculoides]
MNKKAETCNAVAAVYLSNSDSSSHQPMNQGVMSNIKSHYIRLTASQLVEEIGNEDKQSQKQLYIVTAMDYINAVRNEVTENCMNRVCKKLWSKVCNDFLNLFEKILTNSSHK